MNIRPAILLTLGAVLCGFGISGTAVAATPEPDAEAVAKQVQQALRQTPDIGAADISVTTHAGTIVLGGTVSSDLVAAKALSVAEKKAGEVRVISSIEVDAEGSATPSSSVQLVRAVETALRTDARTKNLGVTVSIDEQEAIGLHGLVPTDKDRSAAQAVAVQVPKVTKVRNHLLIPGEAAPPRATR